MRCIFRSSDALKGKGIGLIYECTDVDITFEDLDDLRVLANSIAERLSQELGFRVRKVEFSNNEDIGSDYMLYRFRVWSDLTQEFACSIRILAYRDNVKLVISTINEELLKELPKERISQLTVVESEAYSVLKKSYAEDDIPRGQRVIPKLIVYRILGQPRFDIGEWRLRVEGHVTNNIELTYDELLSLPTIKYRSDLHCVTGWSVKDIEWEGVPLRYFAEKAGVKEGVEWVHFESMDGYTTVVHIDDFMDENAILAIRIDGRPLRPEHGYPARAFIPHLYGWKGAKWVTKITFLTRYTDGYWEALGYHERGNAWLEERFKHMKKFKSNQ